MNGITSNINMLRDRLYGRKTNSTGKNIAIAAGVVAGAAIVGYTAMWLYRKWKARQDEMMSQEDGQDTTKAFAPSYRAKHKPHHRKTEANGHLHN